MYRKLKMLEYKRSYNLPFSLLIPDFERVNSGTGREWKKSIPKIREREGNEKNPFPKFGNGKGMKKIQSQSSGKGIRGLHSWECPGTGIPAHPCSVRIPPLVSSVRSSNSSHPSPAH